MLPEMGADLLLELTYCGAWEVLSGCGCACGWLRGGRQASSALRSGRCQKPEA